MALAKQNIPFILTQGIDNKTSDKLYQGQLSEAINIQMKKTGVIQKRYGVQALGSTDSSGNTLSNFEKLGKFNSELLAYANGITYSYAESLSKWFNKGGKPALNVSRENTIRNSFSQSVPDVATKNGVTIVAWEDARGGVRASVIDNDSGQLFINDTQIDGTGTRPRCLALLNSVILFWVDASNVIKMAEVNTANPSTFSSAVTVGTANANGFYDVVRRNDSQGIIIHSTAAGTDLRFAYILTDPLRVGTALDGLPNAVTKTALNPTSALNAFIDSVGDIYAFYYTSASGVYYQAVTSVFATKFSETQINASTTDDVSGGFAVFEKTTGNYTLIYDRDAAATNNYRIQTAIVDDTGSVVSAEATLIRSLGLISKAFNDDYFIASFQSVNNLQDTYFVMNTEGEVISRFSTTVGGGHLDKAGQNVNVINVTGDTYITATQIKTKFLRDEGTFLSTNGVDRVTLSFNTSGVFYEQLGLNTHLTGGIITNYDGKQIVEHGFNMYPENVQLAESTGGSLTLTGVYGYVVIYQYEDAQGLRHQSTTSIPVSITLTGSNNRVTLTIPTLRVTDKSNVTIEIYRTEDSGTIYYRLTSFASPTFNDTTVDTIAYVDDAADSTITDNELLYTTGNVLDNSPPPAATATTVFQNRLWLAGLEEPDSIWFSKELVSTEGVAFSEFLQLKIDSVGGSVKALKALDDKLIILKSTMLFALTGQGPTSTGQGGSYTVQQIASEVGAIDAATVVALEFGIMFKSEKGIYLLDRSLTPQYIGAQVEDFNDLNMTSAVLIENNNEVRFTHSDGQCLVYNYYFRQWYTFSNYESRSAISLNAKYYKIKENDRIVDNEIKDYYGDRLQPIIMTIITGWFRFAGINGYKRIYEIQTVGNYNTTHSVLVSLSYDYSESVPEAFYWTPGINKAYGEESPYGTEIYGGGPNDDVFYYRIKPSRQKCTSIRVKIQDSYPSSNLDKGFELNGFSFQVGIKGTTRKPNSGLTISGT